MGLLLELLFDRIGSEIPITGNFVKTAASNHIYSDHILRTADFETRRISSDPNHRRSCQERSEERGQNKFLGDSCGPTSDLGDCEEVAACRVSCYLQHGCGSSKDEVKVREMMTQSAVLDTIEREEGAIPLHMTAMNRNLAIFKLLLDTGTMDVNKRNHKGTSPLHVAAIYD